MTRRPNGASASSDASKTSPPAISNTTSTWVAAVGLDAGGSVRPAGAESMAASAPSSSASSRFSALEAVAITRPAPIGAGELDGERAVPARRGVHDDGSRPAPRGRSCAAGARRSGPGAAARAPRRRRPRPGPGSTWRAARPRRTRRSPRARRSSRPRASPSSRAARDLARPAPAAARRREVVVARWCVSAKFTPARRHADEDLARRPARASGRRRARAPRGRRTR